MLIIGNLFYLKKKILLNNYISPTTFIFIHIIVYDYELIIKLILVHKLILNKILH